MAEANPGGLPGGFGLRTLLLDARWEAQHAGSRDVRAEHLLLALAASSTPAGRVLSEAGLDRAALTAALQAERDHSLAAVGMPPIPADRLQATGSAGTPGWGASAREALIAGRRQAHMARRSLQVARRMENRARRLDQAARLMEENARRIERGERPDRAAAPRDRRPAGVERGDATRPGQVSELDLLHGILAADLGTVPRALALAGIDRAALLDAVDRPGGER